MTFTPVTATASKGLIASLGMFLRYGFWFLVVILLFSSAVVKGIQQRSGSVFLIELAKEVGLATKNLDDQSTAVLTNQNEGKYKNLKDFYALFKAFIIIVAWIKLFAFLFSKSPWSNSLQWFGNYSAAILIFIFLQILINLINGWVSGPGSFDAVLNAISLPFKSFINAFKAIGLAFDNVKGGI
jgi:hypothetical protein